MSNLSPRYFLLIAEHSRCHPGRPSPHGLSQLGSSPFFPFHRTKSLADSFSYSSLSILAFSRMPSLSMRLSFP